MNRWISGFWKLRVYRVLDSSHLVQVGDMGSTAYKKADVSLKIGIFLEKAVDLGLGRCSPWKASGCWLMVLVYGPQWVTFPQSKGRRILFIQENIWLQKLNFVVSCLSKGEVSVDEITGPIPREMCSLKGMSCLWH